LSSSVKANIATGYVADKSSTKVDRNCEKVAGLADALTTKTATH